MSLAEPQYRAVLIAALRSSPFSEHKLPLTAFVTRPSLSALREDVEQRLVLAVGGLTEHVKDLPEIDLYMLARQQRESWTASEAAIVAPHMLKSAPQYGFTAMGATVPLEVGEGILPAAGLFVLQAAEPKERISRLLHDGATTIQHSQDRRASLASAECDPNLDPGCEEGGGDGGGPGPSGPPCTSYRWTEVATFYLYDNGNPFEGNEVEYHAEAGSQTGYVRVTEIDPLDYRTFDRQVICTTEPLSNIVFHVIETDGWPNADDWYSFPFPNTSKYFALSGSDNHASKQLHAWPNGLGDPAVLSVRLTW
jgi:hypothetical protein